MDISDDKTVIGMPMRDTEHGDDNWLSKGYVLQGRYVIEAPLGAGGFGITYLAKHPYLAEVAIKEYLPDGAAVRDSGSQVHVISERYNKMYSWGLHRFLDEARLLRQFNHPNIVSVQDFFEANNTAYLVMNYVRGRSLQAELDGGRVFDEEHLRNIIYPLLDALQCIHREGLYHRDISPDNILLREKDGTPVLIDFGSARYAMHMHGAEQTKDGQDHTPTAIFKQGYSPIEQYEGTDQGPYTDIYALGATLYQTALGTRPPDALKRSGDIRLKKIDPLKPASEKGRGRFSAEFLNAIDAALQLEVDDRPQTIEAWLDIFGKPPQAETQPVHSVSYKPFRRSLKWGMVSVIAIVVAAGLFTLLDFTQPPPTKEDIPALLSEAGRELGNGPFSSRELSLARSIYLQVLTLDQENTRALSGYSATTTLKRFSDAVEENNLGKAATLLDKAETELRRAGIDAGVVTPGRQRLQLRNSEATLRRTIMRKPLSADTWSDIALLLDDMATLDDGESLAEAGRRGLEALKATDSAMQRQDFEAAWSQIAVAEHQLSPLGIAKLQTARSKILTAQKNWQAARDVEIEALLASAEQHLKVRPLTIQPVQQTLQTYQSALDLDPAQPRARAGLSISNNLLKALNSTEKGNFAAANEALSDATHKAGNADLWNGALEEVRQQLATARQTWLVSETRSSTRVLLAQATEGLLDAPFDADTLSQTDRLLKEMQALSREMPELVTETEAALAGSELVALLNNSRTLLENADFEGARNRMENEESRVLSYRIGLGPPFLEKVGQLISIAEIEWNLSQAVTLLSEDLLSTTHQDRARQRLQRVQVLDAGHTVGTAALRAIQPLHDAAEASRGHDYDSAVTDLREAQPPLISLGVSANLFEALAVSIRDAQQAWVIQQRENTITSKLSDAISTLQQRPFDSTAWQESESLFEEVSTIEGGSERASSGKSMLAALRSAKEASDARRFGDALAQITQAEEFLANIGAGHFEQARDLVEATNQVWEGEKRELISEALASAEQILGEGDFSAAVLQQTRQAYQTALELDSGQEMARAGLAVITSLEAFFQALQADDFDRAEQHLAEAASTVQLAQLSPSLLTGAESRLSTNRNTWHTNQARQEILALLQRVSELLGQEDILDQRLVLAEKALQDAAVLSQAHQGLESYTTRSNAGLEAIILLRAVKVELDRNQFEAAKETLSDTRQRLLEAKLDSAVLDNLSQAILSAEIDWLLASTTRHLSNDLGLLISDLGLDKMEENFSVAGALAPERPEIQPALQGIATLRQMKVARSRHDYERAMALIDQATTELSNVGVVDNTFEAIRQRLSQEQQLWKTLSLERDLNAWTSEAINALNRSPFDDVTWQTVASLAEKITSTNTNDQRGLVVTSALNNMRQAKQAADETRFGDAQAYIEEAQSELATIGVRHPLENAYRQLHLASSNALQAQLRLANDALREDPGNGAALVDARAALEPVLTFLPDNTSAKMGIVVIDLIQATNASIAATEFAKSARLLADADQQLSTIEASDPLVPQLRMALLDARRRLANLRPSPGEIYPLISVALEAISNDPLNTEMLDTADKLLHNVLAMQSDQPTALAGLQAVDQLRIAGDALAENGYADARAALEQVERLFVDIGLRTDVLAPAWQALETAEE